MPKTRCEIFSRCVGYLSVVSNWNDSKQAEFGDRVKFDGSIRNVGNNNPKRTNGEIQSKLSDTKRR